MLHARPHLYFSEAVCYNKTITFDRKQEQPMRTKREQIIFRHFMTRSAGQSSAAA